MNSPTSLPQITVTYDGIDFVVRYDSDYDATPTHFATEMLLGSAWIDPRDILRDSLCNCIDWAVTERVKRDAAEIDADEAIDRATFLADVRAEAYQAVIA